MLILMFFFSSRRRHTRFKCDWSSDVCSSDLDECLQEAAPALAVAAENRLSIAEVAFESDGSAVVEGMREWRRGVNPLKAEFLQRQRRKKWRAGGERVDRGAKIMEEAG